MGNYLAEKKERKKGNPGLSLSSINLGGKGKEKRKLLVKSSRPAREDFVSGYF